MGAVAFAVIYILVTTYAASTISCAENANIWIYCICCLVVGGATSALTSLGQLSVWFFLSHPVIYAFMAVWGTLMWSVMDEACYLKSNPDFWSLIFLFKIYVVLTYVGMVLGLFNAAFQIAVASGSLPSGLPGGLGSGFPGAPTPPADGPTETTPLVDKEA